MGERGGKQASERNNIEQIDRDMRNREMGEKATGSINKK